VLTAATAVVSLLFAVVLVGDLLLSGVGGFASAPQPMRQVEEAAPMAGDVAVTREVESERATGPTPSLAAPPRAPREEPEMAEEGGLGAAEATRAAEAPPGAGATPPPALSLEVPQEEPDLEAEEELSAAEATRAEEAPPGAGATPPPAGGGGPTEEARAIVVPTVAPTIAEKSVLTPTIPAEEPVVSEGELGLLEPTPGELEATPSPIGEWEGPGYRRLPWRALEVALGLAALLLTFGTVQAWRARRG
jgi:hypothetical protein